MASVVGLAPTRVCLKGRVRELLCIHGRESGPWSRFRSDDLRVFSAALLPTELSREMTVGLKALKSDLESCGMMPSKMQQPAHVVLHGFVDALQDKLLRLALCHVGAILPR